MFKKLLTYIVILFVGLTGFSIQIKIERHTINWNSSVYVSAGTNDGPTKTNTQNDTGDGINKAIGFFNGLLEVLTLIVSPIIFLASWLMTPDWTSGDLFGMRRPLHDLWIVISNITYFIYAILLIFIALATIFNWEKYSYKQLLPKLALGILLVPLSWWFIQFIISLSSIVTASVINIPLEVVQQYGGKDSWWDQPTIYKSYSYYTEQGWKSDKDWSQSCPTDCQSPRDIMKSGAGMYSALLIYAHGIFKISEPKNMEKIPSINAIKTGGAVVHQLVIGALMFVIFGILVIALVFMLFLRAIKLWIYAIFSPLITLKIVIGDTIFGGKENADSFKITEFMGLAFLPAVVGLALSFGLVVIIALQSPSGTSTQNCDQAKIQTEEGCIIANIGGNSANSITRKITSISGGGENEGRVKASLTILKIGGIELNFYGSVIGKTADVEKEVNNANSTASVLSLTGNIFGTLIVDVIALMFIWLAFTAAKNITKVATVVLKPLDDFGRKMAGAVKYAPIPLTGGMSAASLTKIGDKVADMPREASDERLKSSKIGKILGLDNMANGADIKRLDGILKENKDYGAAAAGSYDGKNALELAMRNGKDAKNIEQIDALMEQYAKKYNNNSITIKDALIKNGMDPSIADKLADKIVAGKKRDDLEVQRLWKEAATKPGSTSTGNTFAGFTTSKAAGNDNIIFNFNNGPRVVFDKTVASTMSAKDVAEKINANRDEFKEEHKISLSELKSMLVNLGRLDAEKVSKEIFDKLDEKVKKTKS